MKTKLIAVLFFCFFANCFYGQTLVKKDFTMTTVEGIFTKYGYTIASKDNGFLEIKTSEGNYFVDQTKENLYLIFNRTAALKKNTDKNKIQRFINNINEGAMIRAYYIPEKEEVGVEYYFPTSSGFTAETLWDVATVFQTLAFGIKYTDNDKILE